MHFRQKLQEAFEAGYRSELNEQKKEVPDNIKTIAGELDKAVKAHTSQAKRLRAAGYDTDEDLPKEVRDIPKELDAAVKMHKSQAERLRKAGLSEAFRAGYRSGLTEQAAGMPDVFDPPPGGSRLPGPMDLLGSWDNIIGIINQVMETISQGLPQHSEFDAMASMVDYDGDGQVTFNDLTIALGLWGQGIMPASAQQYQAGQLIVDDSGIGEQLPPEGEELLNVLTSGQQIKGSVGPRPLDGFGQVGGKTDPAFKFSRPPADRIRPLQMPNRNVSRMGPQLGMGGPPAMPGGMG